MSIRILNQSDWCLWKAIRLQALQEYPSYFGSSFEEEALFSEDDFKNQLTTHAIFGAFVGERLVGSVCLKRFTMKKMQHIGYIWGMYVSPVCRGTGLGQTLVTVLIKHAKKCGILNLNLSCTTTNQAALALYQKNNFKVCGTEKRYLKIDEQFFDAYMLSLEIE